MIGNNRQKSFTIIEALVSIAIFTVVSAALAQVVVSSIGSHTKILTAQDLVDETSYTLEFVSKTLRMATNDSAGSCTGTAGKNYSVSGSTITFLGYDTITASYLCKQFLLENNKVRQRTSPDQTSSNLGVPSDVTSGNLIVNNLIFSIMGDALGDRLQPRVTINIDASSNNAFLDTQSNIKIQTSISQRRLDVE